MSKRDAVFRGNLDARELVHARLVAISQLLGSDRIQIEDCTVGFFESRLYNRSQPLTADRADSPFILHYKGQQKARMLQNSQVI